MAASIKWKLRFNKYCQDAWNIKDGAVCRNSLQLREMNFCCKNSIFDTSRGLDLTVKNIIFQLSQRFVCRINGYWIELDFCQIKNDFLPNTIVIRENLGPLPWSKMELFVTIFWEILRGIGSKTMNRSTLLWNKSYEHGEQIQIPQIHSCTNFNSFLADVSIFYPLKISESLWFIGFLEGTKMETLVRNE